MIDIDMFTIVLIVENILLYSTVKELGTKIYQLTCSWSYSVSTRQLKSWHQINCFYYNMGFTKVFKQTKKYSKNKEYDIK